LKENKMPKKCAQLLCLGAAWAWSAYAAAIGSGSLAEAAKSGDRSRVQELLKQHADVNAAEADGTTAIHWAARNDDVAMAQLLIGAHANVKATDRYGISPLTLAATNGNARMLETLLAAGADVNATLPEGESVLMTAARTGNPEAIKVLVAHHADVNAKEKTLGETALMWAAAENHPAAVAALISADANINARSTVLGLTPYKWVTSGMVSTTLPRGGWTPLMFAARQNSMQAARALADGHADLNQTDPDGATALMIAIINAHFDLANMLIEKGADVNLADDTGMTALYATVDMHTLGAMLSRPSPKLLDDLSSADLVKILLAHGANPNLRLKKPLIGRHHNGGDSALGEGTTVLMRAAKANDVPVMKMLLDAGADPLLTQKDHTTVIMIAAGGGAAAGAYSSALPVTEEGAIEAIQLCLDRGVDVNAFNNLGLSAMHRAAARGADKIVRYLAEHGARLDQRDKRGRSPIDVALEASIVPGRSAVAGHQSTAELLRQLMNAETAAR
jgi:ankyrin repeat protein